MIINFNPKKLCFIKGFPVLQLNTEYHKASLQIFTQKHSSQTTHPKKKSNPFRRYVKIVKNTGSKEGKKRSRMEEGLKRFNTRFHVLFQSYRLHSKHLKKKSGDIFHFKVSTVIAHVVGEFKSSPMICKSCRPHFEV